MFNYSMLSAQSVIGCRLTFGKLCRSNCGAGCGPSYCGAGRCGLRGKSLKAGRAADYDVATYAVWADCGPSYCGSGRAAGSDFQPAQGLGKRTHA